MLGVDLPALAIVGVEVAAPPAREFYSALTQSAGVQRADRHYRRNGQTGDTAVATR